MSFQRAAVAAPAYLRRRRAPKAPKELSTHECVVQLGGEGPLSTWSFARGGASQSVTVPSRIAITAPLAVRDVALAGHGIAWLPLWLVEEDLAKGRLKRVLPEWLGAPMTVWAVFRVELRNAMRVRALIDALRMQLEGGEAPLDLPR
jgi:DNA-binding transcriptional LysR family regulator